MTLETAYPSGGIDGTAIAPTTVNSTDATQSTSTTTGAIKTAGGLGVVKDVYVGGVIAHSVGAVGTPSLTFAGDLNTGIYWIGADSFGLATNGVLRLSVSTTAVTSTLPINGPAGAVGTPAFTGTDLDSGMWFSAANTVDFSAGGVRGLQISTVASGVNFITAVPGATGDSPELSVANSASANTGIVFRGKGFAEWIFRGGSGGGRQFGIQANHNTVGSSINVGGGDNTGTPCTITVADQSGVTNAGIAITPLGTGGVEGPVGAVATPGYTFTGDTDTGMWHSAANTLDFSAGGGRALQLATSAGADNYLSLAGSTGSPEITMAGADTNIGLFLYNKGAGAFRVYSNGGSALQFAVTATASANSYLQATGGAAGNPSTLSVIDAGATNADLELVPLGTGLVRFGAASASVATASTHQIAIKAADGTTYYLLATTVA